MAVRCSVFIGTSLDGYIARKDGRLDWLPMPQPGEEDYGYGEFIATVDTIVMGRKTFQAALAFEEWPYPDKRVVVLSHGRPEVPDRVKVEILQGSPGVIVRHLEKEGARHLYVDGGDTIRRFLGEKLIDHMTITTVPVLIGDGIALFGWLNGDQKWELTGSRSFPDGLVQSSYRAAV